MIEPRALPWAGMSRPFGAVRAISTMEVIEELIRLAKELDAATKRGEDLGLTDDEVAFYDALAANESAVLALGDDKLKVIAAESMLGSKVAKRAPCFTARPGR